MKTLNVRLDMNKADRIPFSSPGILWVGRPAALLLISCHSHLHSSRVHVTSYSYLFYYT